MRPLSWMPALVALAACATKPLEEKTLPVNAQPAPSAALSTSAAASATASDPSARGKAAIGDFGLDLTAINRAVKPGDDFFAYANGAWYERFTIPADKSSYGPFDRLDEISKERVRGIIEKAAAMRCRSPWAGSSPLASIAAWSM